VRLTRRLVTAGTPWVVRSLGLQLSEWQPASLGASDGGVRLLGYRAVPRSPLNLYRRVPGWFRRLVRMERLSSTVACEGPLPKVVAKAREQSSNWRNASRTRPCRA
jgi:hypothetical protein